MPFYKASVGQTTTASSQSVTHQSNTMATYEVRPFPAALGNVSYSSTEPSISSSYSDSSMSSYSSASTAHSERRNVRDGSDGAGRGTYDDITSPPSEDISLIFHKYRNRRSDPKQQIWQQPMDNGNNKEPLTADLQPSTMDAQNPVMPAISADQSNQRVHHQLQTQGDNMTSKLVEALDYFSSQGSGEVEETVNLVGLNSYTTLFKLFSKESNSRVHQDSSTLTTHLNYEDDNYGHLGSFVLSSEVDDRSMINLGDSRQEAEQEGDQSVELPKEEDCESAPPPTTYERILYTPLRSSLPPKINMDELVHKHNVGAACQEGMDDEEAEHMLTLQTKMSPTKFRNRYNLFDLMRRRLNISSNMKGEKTQCNPHAISVLSTDDEATRDPSDFPVLRDNTTVEEQNALISHEDGTMQYQSFSFSLSQLKSDLDVAFNDEPDVVNANKKEDENDDEATCSLDSQANMLIPRFQCFVFSLF